MGEAKIRAFPVLSPGSRAVQWHLINCPQAASCQRCHHSPHKETYARVPSLKFQQAESNCGELLARKMEGGKMAFLTDEKWE